MTDIISIEFEQEKIVCLRKDRKCYACGEVMPKGSHCKKTVQKAEGEFYKAYQHVDIKTCLDNMNVQIPHRA